jgi:hypothetical protein
MPGLPYTIIQIIFAAALVLLLLFVAYMIYNYEAVINVRNAYVLKREVPLFDGYIDFINSTNWSYNTYDKTSSSFKDLTPSINQNGGAEYTYNFWMYLDKTKLKSVSSTDIILLMRGNKIQSPYNNETNCALYRKGKYILVKNPLIRMQADGSAIVVEYNTLTNPDSYRENGKNAIDCSGSWMDQNRGMLGIYNMNDYTYDKKWFMFTIVLKEINPDTDILYKNKTSCKMYINGVNVQDRVVESPYNGSYGSAAMRHNRGPLYINPGDIFGTNESENPVKNTLETTIMMANLTYFNYALSETEVMQLFNKKFTKSPAVPPTTSSSVGDRYPIAPISQDNNNLPRQF